MAKAVNGRTTKIWRDGQLVNWEEIEGKDEKAERRNGAAER